jgi:hypothetical protein
MGLTVEQLEIEILSLPNEARAKLAQGLLRRLEAIADVELKNVLKALMLWRGKKQQTRNIANINMTRQEALEDLLWLSHNAGSRRGERVWTREELYET